MSWLLFLGILALMTAAWWFGREVGDRDGYERGYMNGHTDATEKWRPSDSVRCIPPQD